MGWRIPAGGSDLLRQGPAQNRDAPICGVAGIRAGIGVPDFDASHAHRPITAELYEFAEQRGWDGVAYHARRACQSTNRGARNIAASDSGDNRRDSFDRRPGILVGTHLATFRSTHRTVA